MTGRDAEHDPIREEALDWLLKVEAAPDDEDLKSALAAWRGTSEQHERAYRSVARMWRLAGELAPDPARPAPERPQRVARSRRSRPMAVAAAALAACLTIYAAPQILLYMEADHMTGVGELRKVRLEDGSTLHLDAESAVAVSFGPARRSVTLLAGQAYFDVVRTPSRPFQVAADGLSVTVKGTRFAVEAGRSSVSVAVKAGAVEVAPSRARRGLFRLAPGNRLRMARATGAVTRTEVSPADVASWRDGQLVVDGVPLAEVVERLDRHHRGVIWLHGAALAERRITGVFNLSDPVAALRAAASTQGARVRQLTPYLLVITPG